MFTAMATAVIFLLICTGAMAQTVTECGRSDGYAYYFSGGFVPADKSGWRKDGIDGGKIILNYTNGKFDLLIKKRYWFHYLPGASWLKTIRSKYEQRFNCDNALQR